LYESTGLMVTILFSKFISSYLVCHCIVATFTILSEAKHFVKTFLVFFICFCQMLYVRLTSRYITGVVYFCQPHLSK
ncbi:MAG: hypothetical protein ACLTBU_11550, partial [Zhenhengia sp.]|uniref:hypothetical protein n=1 Tax=Zhenhengia sp. TaxID=2944208 RepID=UPI003993964C